MQRYSIYHAWAESKSMQDDKTQFIYMYIYIYTKVYIRVANSFRS